MLRHTYKACLVISTYIESFSLQEIIFYQLHFINRQTNNIDVFLTLHLSIFISVIIQLYAQNFVLQ